MPTTDAAMRWPRTRITVLAVPMVAFTIALYVGNALAPTLIKDAPRPPADPRAEDPLAAPDLERRRRAHVLPRPAGACAARCSTVYFLLGHWYGDRSLRWLEQRTGNALRPVLWVERNFHRAAHPGDVRLPGQRQRAARRRRRHAGAALLLVALASVALRLWAVRALAEVLRGSDPRGRAVDRRQPAVAHRGVGGRRHDLGRLVEPSRARAPPTPSTRSSTASDAGGRRRPGTGAIPDEDDAGRTVTERADRRDHRPSRNRSGPSSPSTTSAISRPTSGANLKPWPEHGDATTTGPTRSMTKSSVAVVV